MGDRYDYLALQWIKGEIGETLKKVRQSIEAYAENPEQLFPLYMCRDHVHQAHRILQIVKLRGCAIFVEELQLLIEAIIDGRIKDRHEAMEVAMAAVIQLPTYLDHVQETRIDQPLGLLPLMNEMRSARGEAPISETGLFTPDLSSLPQQSVSPKLVTDDLVADLRKARQAVQIALTGFIRNKDTELHLGRLTQVFQLLERLSSGLPVATLWHVVLGFLEGATNKAYSGPGAVRNVLRRIDHELRRLLENPQLLAQPASEELVRTLLFYIGHADVDSPAVAALKERFHLDQALEESNAAIAQQASIIKPDAGALRSVVDALSEELGRIKDSFDVFVRSGGEKPKELSGLLAPMKQIADTLAVLGLAELRRTVLVERNLMGRIVRGQAKIETSQLMEMAGALLSVETQLREIAPPEDDPLSDQSDMPSANIEVVQQVVIKETRSELSRVKDGIVEFISSHWDHQYLDPVPERLRQVAGGLAIMSMERAADLIKRCASYVQDQVLADGNVPVWDDLDSLADALTAVDYFLERKEEDLQSEDESSLDIAEKMVARLQGAEEAGAGQSLDLDYQFSNLSFADEKNHGSPAKSDQAAGEAAGVDKPQQAESPALEPEHAEPEPDSVPEFEQSEAAVEFEAEPKAEQPAVEPAASESDTEAEPAPAFGEADDQGEEADDEIREIFIEEAAEVQETLEGHLAQLQSGSHPGDLTEVRRAFHTLKGSGRMVGATVVGELAWAVENLLNHVLSGSITLSDPIRQLVVQVIGRLPALLEEFGAGKQHEHQDITQLAEAAHAMAEGQPATLPGPVSAEAGLGAAEVAGPPAEQTPPAETPEPAPEAASPEDQASEEEAAAGSDNAELLDIFLDETATHLTTIGNYLKRVDGQLPAQVDDDLYRALHTLKGSAAMAGVEAIRTLVLPIDRLARECLNNRRLLDQPEIDLLSQTLALLQDGCRQLRDTGTVTLPEAADIQARAEQLLRHGADDQSGASLQERLHDLLAEHLDELLSMDDRLEAWKADAQAVPPVNQLVAQLRLLTDWGKAAELSPLVNLGQALDDFYQAIADKRLEPGPKTAEVAEQGQEALLSIIDCLAARQVVKQTPEIQAAIEALHHHLASEGKAAEARVAVDTMEPPAALAEPQQPDSAQVPELEEPPAMAAEADAQDDAALEPPVPSFGQSEAAQADSAEEDILSLFLDEGNELLESLEQAIGDWHDEADSLEPLAEVLRLLHTFKGAARAAGLSELGNQAHDLESQLNLGRQNGQAPEQILDQAESGLQHLSDALADISHGGKKEAQALADEGEPEPPFVPSFAESEAPAAASADSDNEIRELFLEEGAELLDNLEQAVGRWGEHPDTLEPLAEVLRLLHTFKGAARAAALTELGSLAHDLESRLNLAKQNGQEAEQILELAESGSQLLNDALEQIAHSGTMAPVSLPEVEAGAQPATPAEQGQAAPSEAPQEPAASAAQPAASGHSGVQEDVPYGTLPGENEVQSEAKPQKNVEQVKVAANLLEDVTNLAAETSIYRSQIDQQVASLHQSLSEMDITIERTRDLLRRLDTETQAQVMSHYQVESHREGDNQDFDPLEMDRYSQLQQLSRALFESASDLVDLRETLSVRIRDTQTLLSQQARINSELQDDLVRTRMVPFERSALRLRRIVRQTSKELGKEVELVINNAEGEIDRTIMEHMVAPLEHMVRNSLDHGIESKEDRLAAGKPEVGRITLTIRRDAGEVVVALADDGRGISVDAVRKKAIEKGLLAPDEELSDNQVLRFIMESGFSTAAKVTQLSGRGVGMDVVNSEVRGLGGSIDVESELGKGTQFTLRLPFNSSVDRALMVHQGEAVYAIPLSSIEGVTRVRPQELDEFYSKGKQNYFYGNTENQVISLAELLGGTLPPRPKVESVPLIMINFGSRHLMVLVDELSGSQEIVVKSLGTQFAAVRGLSGATFLSDGQVAVILDLRAFIRDMLSEGPRKVRVQKAEPSHRRLQVLVVDDSITVRKVTSRLLERNGMEALTAKDGVEAITMLQDIKPDLMLLDIEMPRMDGFEVAAQVRHSERLNDMPIIMITSRTGEKHRNRAISLGVNGYLGKPFQEAELLAHIRKLTGASQGSEVSKK